MSNFEKDLKAGIEAMVKNANTDMSTRHVNLSLEGVPLSKGVTEESLELHALEINRLGVMAQEAVAEITRSVYDGEAETPVLNLDGTLSVNGIAINSAHHLREGEGDDVMYGTSYTAIDMQFNQQLNSFISDCHNRNIELAEALFK